jgi:hypothetical protein
MIASTENRPMLYSLLACCAGTFIAAFEVIPMLNEKLQVRSPLGSVRHRTCVQGCPHLHHTQAIWAGSWLVM